MIPRSLVRPFLGGLIAILLAAPVAHATPLREAAAEAERLARALLAAGEPAEAEALVLEVLERVGIGVYDAIGTPVVVGNEQSEDGLWLLDAEVEALAIAFVEGQLTPLDMLAADLREAGVEVVEEHRPTPVTGGIVERALRRVRADVERDPRHPQAFLILLIDALGDREEFPFDLLEEEEAELGFAAPGPDAVGSMMRGMFEQALRDAIADEDPEAASMFDAVLEDDATFDAMMAAMMRGDMATVMELLMGADAVREVEEARQFLQEDLADPETPPEARAFLEATDTLLSTITTPGDASGLALMQASLATLAATRDLQRAALEHDAAEWDATLTEIMGADVDASSRYHAFVSLAGVFPLLEWRAYEFENLEAFVEDMEATVEEQLADHEEGQRKAETLELPWEDDDPSDLLLDPLQVVLVAVDLLVEPRPPRTATIPFGTDRAWDDGAVLARSSTEGRCLGIGQLQAAYPDGFGALENVLAVTRTVRDALTEAATGGARATLKRLAGTAVNWATIRLEVTVEYLPNDAGGATGGIHRPYHRDDDRRVILHAQVRDTLPELLPPQLRGMLQQVGGAVQVCGFLKDIARDFGGPAETLADLLDALERIDEGRDLESLPVVVDLAGDAWSVLHVRARDWDGQRGASGMTMIARTDETGYASGPLLPRLTSPDVGGLRTIESVPVRVQLILTESAEIAVRRSRLAASVAEEVLRPVQRWVQVHVAHYEPLPIRGSLTLDRTVSEVGFVGTFVDDVAETVERVGNYRLELTVEDATIVAGAGPASATTLPMPLPIPGAAAGARLTAAVTYELTETTVREWTGDCDGVPTTFTRTTVITTDFRGRGSGPSPQPTLEVRSATDRYAVHPAVPTMAVMMALATGSWSGNETIETTTVGCGPPTTESDSGPVGLTEDALGVVVGPVNVPGNEFRPFERGAQRLAASFTWEAPVPSRSISRWLETLGRPQPDVSFEVTNRLSWDFTRGD